MPELPEVETLKLQLSHLITGLTIKEIEILKTKSFIGDKRLLLGKKIIDVRRLAKILVIDLSGGLSLAIHLKMSGQLVYREYKINYKKQKDIDPLLINLPNKHTRVIVNFINRNKLFFNDMRIFGWMKIVGSQNFKSKVKIIKLEELIVNLGPEPLKDLTLEKFKDILKRSKKPIKLLLMSQDKISGVGNIYANDVLFLSGINPKTPANKLPDAQIFQLFNNLNKVLTDGIKWGGASRNNFRDAYGRRGKVQEHFYVYNQAGKDCINHCGDKIKRIKLGGRGTFFCPKCQKMMN